MFNELSPQEIKFCIAIPVRNGEEFLEQSILSIISQKGNFDLHLHIQDGKSEDATLEIIKKFERLVKTGEFGSRINLTWNSTSDDSMWNALNIAFEYLSGTHYGWIGFDDLLLPGSLSTVAEFFRQYPSQHWVTGLNCLRNENGIQFAIQPGRSTHAIAEGFSATEIINGTYDGNRATRIQAEGTFWDSELWINSGEFFSEEYSLAGDAELWMRFAQYSEVVQIVSQLGSFRSREMQLSSNKNLYLEQEKQICASYSKKIGLSDKQLVAYTSYPDGLWTLLRTESSFHHKTLVSLIRRTLKYILVKIIGKSSMRKLKWLILKFLG